MDVFLLWHIYELKDDFGTQDEEKLIGVFSSELRAREAIERLRGGKGFGIFRWPALKYIKWRLTE